MSETIPASRSQKPRVLLFSQRNLYRPEVWRCSFHEFERLLPQLDAVDIVSPRPGRLFDFRRRNAQRIGTYIPVALNPGIERIRIRQDYEVLMAVCEKPSELLHVNVLQGWRERCRTSICWLPELWVKDIPTLRGCLSVLSRFDHVVLNVARAVGPLSRAISKPCTYLPAGIDALSFCPYPNPPSRCIDVLSIGRRSERTHKVLLRMVREKGLFYLYDTLKELYTDSLEQHRELMSNMTRRSRYFIVNPGKIDSPGEIGGQLEFGYRYFEGAAAGAILIGDHPDSQEFQEHFGWHDAVIRVPFDSDRINAVIEELDAQPERQERIRQTNVAQSLLRHDWAYRWERLLDTAGLKPSPELLQRKQRLSEMARSIERPPDSSSGERQGV